MSLKVVTRFPTVEEYNALRKSVEWPIFEDHIVRDALSRTLFCVCVEDNTGSIAGMGRILGDNAIYLHIQDVIVDPRYQGQGVGRMIMTELMKYIEKAGTKNTNIGLMCSKGREKFYQGFGFMERPSEKFGAGMIRIKD
jgi:ribosomal protein S18 acetylase RimI-like enzyme